MGELGYGPTLSEQRDEDFAILEAELTSLRRERDEARDLLDSNVSFLGKQLADMGRERDEMARRLEEAAGAIDLAWTQMTWAVPFIGTTERASGDRLREFDAARALVRRAAAVSEGGDHG